MTGVMGHFFRDLSFLPGALLIFHINTHCNYMYGKWFALRLAFFQQTGYYFMFAMINLNA